VFSHEIILTEISRKLRNNFDFGDLISVSKKKSDLKKSLFFFDKRCSA